MSRLDHRLTRREALKLGAAGILASSVSGWFEVFAGEAAKASAQGVKHKSCILLWMNGGPSQSHLFDIKPGVSHYNAIGTSAPGIQISEHLPHIARQMQNIALLRSMSTDISEHRRARYLLRTGYNISGAIVYPTLGSIAASELGDVNSELPNFVVVNGGVDGNNAGNPGPYSAGYLGPHYAPLMIGNPDRGLENLEPEVNMQQFDERAELLDVDEQAFMQQYQAEAAAGHRAAYQRAVRLMHSDRAKAFDIEKESSQVRDAYGRNNFGNSCLLARRLVEAGVPFVEVTLGGWDDHQGATERIKKRSGYMDPAMAALISDLKTTGLLDSTLVIWMGEFGRSPGDGSKHFSKGWTTALAGAGLRTGQAIGQTSKNGAEVESRPINAPDFMATVAKALGMDPEKSFQTKSGRPIRMVDKGGTPIKELFA